MRKERFFFSILDFQDDDAVLAEVDEFTAKYASVDRMIRSTIHPLDDYEAVLIAALGDCQSLPLEPPDSSSIKSWLQWKIKVMDFVYALAENPKTGVSCSTFVEC